MAEVMDAIKAVIATFKYPIGHGKSAVLSESNHVQLPYCGTVNTSGHREEKSQPRGNALLLPRRMPSLIMQIDAPQVYIAKCQCFALTI